MVSYPVAMKRQVAHLLGVLALLAAAVDPSASRALENGPQEDYYAQGYYGYPQPVQQAYEAPQMIPAGPMLQYQPMAAVPQQPVYQYPVAMDAGGQLGPNFAGLRQAPYQEITNDEEFNTLVKDGGPYSGAYAAESLLRE